MVRGPPFVLDLLLLDGGEILKRSWLFCGHSSPDGTDFIDLQTVEFRTHVFQLQEEDSVEETQPGEDVPSFNQWLLPSYRLDGLWDR